MALSLKQIIVLYSYNASNKMYQRGYVDNSMEMEDALQNGNIDLLNL